MAEPTRKVVGVAQECPQRVGVAFLNSAIPPCSRGTKLKLIGRHNGKVVQEATTDMLIFSIDTIVSYISRYVTLEPGDVIFTGTPGTTQAMQPGDTYEVEIEGIGLLRNKVVAAGR